MPLVKYTFTHPEGHELTETDYIPATNDAKKTLVEYFPDIPYRELNVIKVEILNPFVHPHDWKKSHKQGERMYYRCGRCGIISYRRINMFSGEIGQFNREEQWKSVKYERCHDPLKQMPPSTKLFK